MIDKTILITRPVGDEKALTDLLHSRGYRVIHEPLTGIFLKHTERTALEHALHDEPDAIIVTSRHAAHALALLSDMRDTFLVCVGDATARVATSMGFSRVSVAGGTAQSLIKNITDSYDPGSRFLYVSGDHVRVDIEAELGAQQMDVERVVLYEAIAAEQLSDTLLEHLRRRQIDGVTLLSHRTAQIFTDLLEKAGAQDSVTRLDAFCLSAAVAEPLQSQPWKTIHVTSEPTLASVIECVDNAYHAS